MANLGNGVTATFYYLHVNTSAPTFNALKVACAAKHHETVPDANLSVDIKLDGTQAIIKVTNGSAAWFASLPAAQRGLIIDSSDGYAGLYPESAIALVRAKQRVPGWWPTG